MAGSPSVNLIWIDSKDAARLHRSLYDMDRKASAQLTRRLRQMGEQYIPEVQAAANALPSKPRKRTASTPAVGLREGIARSVEIKVGRPKRGAFIRLRISGTKFAQATGKYRKLPRYVEGLGRRGKRWRRPAHAPKGVVKGAYTGRWVTQRHTPFLLPTLLPKRQAIGRMFREEYREVLKREFQKHGLKVTSI